MLVARGGLSRRDFGKTGKGSSQVGRKVNWMAVAKMHRLTRIPGIYDGRSLVVAASLTWRPGMNQAMMC